MIVFNGDLTGSAKKYYIEKMLKTGTKLLIALIIIATPMWVFLSIITNTFAEVMGVWILFLVLSPIIFRVCVSKKERQRMNLKRVCIDDNHIKATSDKTRICSDISKVREVRDYGEFYDVIFPSIYFTSIYVCQKDLLSKGSLEEFESFFEGKIVRNQSKQEK